DQQRAVVPQVTRQNQHANTPPAATSGLSGNIRLWLVLFDLLLALGLGLLARNILKKSSRSMQISGLLDGNLQEKQRGGFLQPAALFQASASAEAARTTESLTWSTPMTGALATSATFSTHSSDGLLPLSVFAAMQAQDYSQYPTGQLPISTPLQSDAQVAHQAPSHSGIAAFSPLHRTRLTPSRANADQFPSFIADTATEKLPQLAGVGQSSSFVPGQQQPQLVGAGAGGGRSNGLLSRYREAQAHGEEPHHV
ncbi:MAG: hypothetical protein ACRDHW_18615, partial [Ktedonobacteraceae bacterium]